MFDYEKLIEQHGISADMAQAIIDDIRDEFADDEMMMEIHIIRALRNYIRNLSNSESRVS